VDFSQITALLAFWAGNVGLIVGAAEMSVVNQQGVVPLDQIEGKYHQWWQYWKAYWQAKRTGVPLPEDYACEVTFPIKDDPPLGEESIGPSLYQCTRCGAHNQNKLCPTCGALWGAP
jgi:hypothetical protein